MEIRLAKFTKSINDEDITITFLNELSVEQFNTFQKAIITIEELKSIRRLRDFVTQNDEDIIEMLNNSLKDLVAKSLNSWYNVKNDDNDPCFKNANRLLLNYLSSIRTFLDHSETFIKRKYGNKSKQFSDYKTIQSYFYDNSFAYRFFYKLRNYSQHIGIPIDIFYFTTKYNNENNSIKGTLKVAFDRDKLIHNYDSWGIVKKDLISQNQEFDLTPLIFEMTHNIREMEKNIEIIHKNELLKAANYITNLISHIATDKESEIFVAFEFKKNENGELEQYSSQHIPFDMIYFIQNELDKNF
jgi:hypothetical protein